MISTETSSYPNTIIPHITKLASLSVTVNLKQMSITCVVFSSTESHIFTHDLCKLINNKTNYTKEVQHRMSTIHYHNLHPNQLHHSPLSSNHMYIYLTYVNQHCPLPPSKLHNLSSSRSPLYNSAFLQQMFHHSLLSASNITTLRPLVNNG